MSYEELTARVKQHLSNMRDQRSIGRDYSHTSVTDVVLATILEVLALSEEELREVVAGLADDGVTLPAGALWPRAYCPSTLQDAARYRWLLRSNPIAIANIAYQHEAAIQLGDPGQAIDAAIAGGAVNDQSH